MGFNNFVNEICRLSNDKKIEFADASNIVKEYVDSLDKENLIDIVKEIGTIPECIKASSSAEKLFSRLLIAY